MHRVSTGGAEPTVSDRRGAKARQSLAQGNALWYGQSLSTSEALTGRNLSVRRIHPLFMNPLRGTGITNDTFSIDMVPLTGNIARQGIHINRTTQIKNMKLQ
jgi:hypothetical protein